jgi:Flp pilus assembly pilin Flp
MKTSIKVQTMSGWKMTVAVCVAGLLAALPPKPVLASQFSLAPDISVNVGPIAMHLNITQPVAQPDDLFHRTLHIHARDDTQKPPFNTDLVATGQAPDVDTLVGGFVPGALIILKDLAAGMSFQQAATDAQAKTGVTVTFLNDPGLTEYALILALIAIIAISALTFVQGLSDQAGAIRSNLEAGLGAAGLSANSPDPCVIP